MSIDAAEDFFDETDSAAEEEEALKELAGSFLDPIDEENRDDDELGPRSFPELFDQGDEE
ncbi:MAG TPA: hypothetical protein VMD74_01680 [Candidatus Methylomirabilis sp.]|nr:hypothetical protein [Candidatus Methylomirabilis sp.]